VAVLDRQRPAWLWIEVLILTFLTGFSDYLTGYEVSVVLFYSVPILMMVRFADQGSAVFVALLCSIAWWWADESSGHHYTSVWHQSWETAVRLAYFLLYVVGGSAVKARIELLSHTQQLEREIIRISESEQHRIGQDLHDGLCQYFAAIGFSAGSIKGRLARTGSPEAVAVAEIQELILDGVQQTRALARGLFPVQNDEWGLPSALTELATSTTRLLNLHCTFASNASTIPIKNECSTHLYRIAQEALSNAARHGAATRATINLTVDDEALTLSIENNGANFDQSKPDRKGLGLTIMQYRARQMGGRIVFADHETAGTTVSCRLPLSAIRTSP
jgi:signal transduction histidine kinase